MFNIFKTQKNKYFSKNVFVSLPLGRTSGTVTVMTTISWSLWDSIPGKIKFLTNFTSPLADCAIWDWQVLMRIFLFLLKSFGFFKLKSWESLLCMGCFAWCMSFQPVFLKASFLISGFLLLTFCLS